MKTFIRLIGVTFLVSVTSLCFAGGKSKDDHRSGNDRDNHRAGTVVPSGLANMSLAALLSALVIDPTDRDDDAALRASSTSSNCVLVQTFIYGVLLEKALACDNKACIDRAIQRYRQLEELAGIDIRNVCQPILQQ